MQDVSNGNISIERIETVLNCIKSGSYQSEVISLIELISDYDERGTRITLEQIYNNYGNYPVYSSTITGPIGYYKYQNKQT